MNGLKEFILGLCVIYILQSVFIVLSPEKYKNAVRLSFSIIILTVIATKLYAFDYLSLFNGITDVGNSYIYDESDNLIISDIENKVADYLMQSFHSKGINSESVMVNATIDNERCISITVVSVVLDLMDRDKQPQVVSIIENLVGDVDVDVSFSEE